MALVSMMVNNLMMMRLVITSSPGLGAARDSSIVNDSGSGMARGSSDFPSGPTMSVIQSHNYCSILSS